MVEEGEERKRRATANERRRVSLSLSLENILGEIDQSTVVAELSKENLGEG